MQGKGIRKYLCNGFFMLIYRPVWNIKIVCATKKDCYKRNEGMEIQLEIFILTK